MYLTNQQLAELIDCNPTSYKCMRRWLDRNGWPYAIGITGAPKVTKEYHDSRMGGKTAEAVLSSDSEPNFGALINGR